MTKLIRDRLTVAAAAVAAAVAGATVAGAADKGSPSDTTAQRSSGETPLTGTTKAQVRRAALAEVDGTVLRVETDAGGVYEAHIRKADGTEVEVKVNKAFEVTAVNELDGDRRRGGPHGHGPGGHADLAAVAQTLGVTEAELRSALEAGEKARQAAVAKALGKDAAEIREAFEAARPGG